ncbi:MAG: hypothetical protein FJW90_09055 [Actinobacteria bacterium]|nr:hypothetical protein [Actinomycetota bacterium]
MSIPLRTAAGRRAAAALSALALCLTAGACAEKEEPDLSTVDTEASAPTVTAPPTPTSPATPAP